MSRAEISDWPAGYVEKLRERDPRLHGASDEKVRKHLLSHHRDMRFGRYIDLDIQQGFYLHRGSGLVEMDSGSDSGYVIGALGEPAIDVTANGEVDWWASEAEAIYVRSGPDKLSWALAHASGPWLLTADYHEGRASQWYWLVIRFLSRTDDAAFRAAFPEVSA